MIKDLHNHFRDFAQTEANGENIIKAMLEDEQRNQKEMNNSILSLVVSKEPPALLTPKAIALFRTGGYESAPQSLLR
jgi:hypothetical protein